MDLRNTSGWMHSDPVLELARRSAVRLVVGGAAALSLASLLQVIVGDAGGPITLIASLTTAAIAAIMLRQERPNVVALLGLVSLFAIVAETYAAIDGQSQYVASVGAETVLFALGILSVFIARKHPRVIAVSYLAASALIVFIAQLHLNGLSLEIASDIVVMLATLGTLMYIVIRVIESLSASETRYSDLANVIPVATMELDVSGVLERIADLTSTLSPDDTGDNLERYTEMLGLVKLSFSNHAANRLVDQLGRWEELASGPNAALVRTEAVKVLLSVWQGVNAGAGEVSVVSMDGTEMDFFYRWSLGHVGGRAVPGTLVVAATDVTRLRQAEHELGRQLQERDQFVASVSHELRTPLTSVMGLTEELVSRPDDFDAAEQAELLAIVATETRDVVDIVEDLLVTARAEAGQLQVSVERCDLAAETRRLAELLGGEADAVGPVWTEADPVRLRQVLRNLLSNAQRYGGPNVRMTVSATSRVATFEIRDDGDPLPFDARDRIFEAYERVGKQGAVGSVGLGLHVARLLARLMGGDLTYDHDGVDTVFSLSLPAAHFDLIGSSHE
ncbi:MAG: HAMP domain-containing histidine kinase [bacterium]|nr:HAMP domain-containing histidine kinase [bacterium]